MSKCMHWTCAQNGILEEAGASVHNDSGNEVVMYLTRLLIEFYKWSQYWVDGQTTESTYHLWYSKSCAEISLCPTYISPLREVIFSCRWGWHQKEQRPCSSLRATTIFSGTSAHEPIKCYIFPTFHSSLCICMIECACHWAKAVWKSKYRNQYWHL